MWKHEASFRFAHILLRDKSNRGRVLWKEKRKKQEKKEEPTRLLSWYIRRYRDTRNNEIGKIFSRSRWEFRLGEFAGH